MNGNFRGSSSTKTPTASPTKSKKDEPTPLKIVLKAFLVALAIVFSLLIVVGSAAAGLVFGGGIGIIKTTPMLDPRIFKNIGLNSYVYDAEGNVIAELKQEENRVWINYNEIPKMLINAYIAVEDKRFFEHEGIDYRRIANAGFTYIKKILGKDVDISGGSTITQQLIKNRTGNDDVTITRKLQEQWQALQLEKVLTKEEILTHYLNNVPLGGTFYGVETAAKGYFGKDVRELSLAECASLAGITKWPTRYMPINETNIERNLARTKMILGLMLEQGMITQSEYDEAIQEKIEFKYNSEAGKVMQTSNQSYFVDEAIKSVKNQLMKTYGYTEQAAIDLIYNSGLHIYTTMDPKVQGAMDEVFTDPEYFKVENKKASGPPQAAMVVMDKDGYVRGIYGGQGAKEGSVFNRATQAERSPGSSIKPLLVYGPGIDSKTLTAATVVDDVKQYLLNDNPTKEWPKNSDNKHYGLTGVRVGIYKSINVVATLLLRDNVGITNGLNYLAKMGIDRKNEQYLSIAMGGFSKGMTPLQMAAAYTTFVNKGVYTKPIFFTEVKDNEGNILLSNKPERTQVFSEQTVFIMDNMLEDVVKKGTAAGHVAIKYKDEADKTITIPTAGKTGTTDSNKDKWFCGYTPYYAAATWYGYDTAVELTTEERNHAMKIWNAVMNKIHEGMPSVPFFDATPPGIVKRTICIDSGKIATDLCKADPRGGHVREEYFIEGTEPAYNDTCTVHVKAKVCITHEDAYGKYLLANEYCPASTVVEKIFIKRPVEYKPKNPNDGYPLDYTYELPEGEYCPVHGPGTLVPPQQEELVPPVEEKDYIPVPWDSPSPHINPSGDLGMVEEPLQEDIGEPIEEEDWGSVDWGNDPNAWN